MSRRQKKINRLIDDIIGGEIAIAGFDFNRSDIQVRNNNIFASGDYLNLGEVDLLIKFNKKVQIKKLSASIEYSSFDGFLSQSWTFSNYKKFEKAAIGSHEDEYVKAANLSGKGIDYFDKAVDLYESIPGVRDLTVRFYESGYGFQTWS